MRIIFDYNRTIFDPEKNDLYFGVLDLLEKLSAKHELSLVSRNEPERKEKIEELNIKKYFQRIHFTEKKSKKLFLQIAGDARVVFVVGDSISDEIKIGNQLGFVTVRLRKGKFAAQVSRDDELAKFEIENVGELENIISNYEK